MIFNVLVAGPQTSQILSESPKAGKTQLLRTQMIKPLCSLAVPFFSEKNENSGLLLAFQRLFSVFLRKSQTWLCFPSFSGFSNDFHLLGAGPQISRISSKSRNCGETYIYFEAKVPKLAFSEAVPTFLYKKH